MIRTLDLQITKQVNYYGTMNVGGGDGFNKGEQY
jgi:hypothetical protein